MAELTDEQLRQSARTRLAASVATELETLHLKRQREGLSEAEPQRCDDLMRQYERNMLQRAKTAALLKSRGVDVDGLVAT